MKLKHITLFGTLLLVVNHIYACTCESIDSTTAKRLIKEVEFVIIGHAVRNINFNDEVRIGWDKRQEGFEVIFKIDSVIKGDSALKEVILNQFSTGNCKQVFEFEKKYLIAGNQLTQFVNKIPKRQVGDETEISLPDEPPPPFSILNSKMICYNNEQEEVDYWNNLATNQSVIFASQCSSFSMGSQLVNYFLEQ